MKKIFTKINFGAIMFLMPFLVKAQNVNVSINQGSSQSACPNEINSIADFFFLAICILRRAVWPLLISIAVIVFIVGVIKYVANGDDESKRTEGRNFMIYGIIGLFVMVSVWGLVGVLQGTFGIGTSTFIPQLPED